MGDTKSVDCRHCIHCFDVEDEVSVQCNLYAEPDRIPWNLVIGYPCRGFEARPAPEKGGPK